MKGRHRKRPDVPHLFGKLMVLWCVFWGTAFCGYALWILSHTGHDAAGLLGVILAFLGGELLMMCLKNVLGDDKKSKKGDMNDEDRLEEEAHLP